VLKFKSYAIKEASILRLKEQEALGVHCPYSVWSYKAEEHTVWRQPLFHHAMERQGYYACALGEIGIAAHGAVTANSAFKWMDAFVSDDGDWAPAERIVRAYNDFGPAAAIKVLQEIEVA
jgi:hypothetical protein